MTATALPCVVLGGVPGPDPTADLSNGARVLRHPVVRGLVVGRTLLDPPQGDVAEVVVAAAAGALRVVSSRFDGRHDRTDDEETMP